MPFGRDQNNKLSSDDGHASVDSPKIFGSNDCIIRVFYHSVVECWC